MRLGLLERERELSFKLLAFEKREKLVQKWRPAAAIVVARVACWWPMREGQLGESE